MERLAGSLGLNGRLTFTGRRPDVASVMAGCTARGCRLAMGLAMTWLLGGVVWSPLARADDPASQPYATGVGGNQADNSVRASGAVYVY